ncbi:hypothetical protein QFZ49_003278 [Streptomyces turgidiscabies]|uniref:Uncharacterized protein n=1 Tax=Streptomyces turgidiscabies TaxID=85558 RepID=A0ABU0RMW5_9ACTN|nr:hypothetical protein [Streptomyces turgidiscabies]
MKIPTWSRPTRTGMPTGSSYSKISVLEQIPDRVLLAAQHHSSVAVAVGHELDPGIQAGLGQDPERDLNRPVLAKPDFRRFPDHSPRMPRSPGLIATQPVHT